MKENQSKFNKRLGTLDILVLSFGAMIGWGWVVSSGNWISKAGVIGTIIGFIIAGIMIYFIGLVYAELTTAFPINGGCLFFSYKAFGKVVSYLCSWFMILGYVGVVCFEACSLPTVISYIFPHFLKGYLYTVAGFDVYATWLLMAIFIAIVITFINIKGVKTAAVFQTILTLIIGLVGLLLIFSSMLNGSVTNLDGQLINGISFDLQLQNIVSIAVVAPFFLFGFDVIPQAAEEINIELKKIGKILVLSIILAVSFYGLVVFAIGLALNVEEVSTSLLGSGLTAADAMKKMFNSEMMSKVLILGGICGIVTSWNSFLIGGSRAIYAMSKLHMIPHTFCHLSKKHNTPVNAILLIGLISCVAPFFGKEMLNWIANCASFSCCISYCIVSLSFLKIRKDYPNLDRPYSVKKWKFIGILAVFMSGFMSLVFLLPHTEASLKIPELLIIIIWGLLGVFFYYYSKYKYKTKLKNDLLISEECYDE